MKKKTTATVKEIRSLANKAEDAATCAANHADTARKERLSVEAAYRATRQVETAISTTATCALQSADRAGPAAEDAASYATTAKYCLIATQIALAVVIIISLSR